MTKKVTPSKAKIPAAKPAAVVRKSVTAKPLVATEVTPKSKIQKAKNVNDKTGDKIIRTSFNILKSDYAKIAELKQRSITAGMKVKKSELVRAGLHVLSLLTASQFKKAIAQVAPIKAEHPNKPKDKLLSD